MTQPQLEQARRLRMSGLSFAEIHKAIGLSEETSVSFLARFLRDIPDRHTLIRANVIAAVRGGMSVTDASVKFGVGETTVRSWSSFWKPELNKVVPTEYRDAARELRGSGVSVAKIRALLSTDEVRLSTQMIEDWTSDLASKSKYARHPKVHRERIADCRQRGMTYAQIRSALAADGIVVTNSTISSVVHEVASKASRESI